MSALGASAVRMANDIARNFAALGEQEAARRTARHIEEHWEPRLTQALQEADGENLSSAALEARAIIERGAASD